MPASLLASIIPWRQILRSCADAPPERAAVTASIAENRTTLERLQRVMLAPLLVRIVPIFAERHLTTPCAPAQGRTAGVPPAGARSQSAVYTGFHSALVGLLYPTA